MLAAPQIFMFPSVVVAIDRLTPSDTLLALRKAGIDFSVSEADLRQWLNNPLDTPYPALAEALLKLLEGKRLRQPVPIDVIRRNYERSPGASSPRSVADVDLPTLRAAVVEGYNERYGRDFQRLGDEGRIFGGGHGVSTGWNGFDRIFSVGDGLIYAVWLEWILTPTRPAPSPVRGS